MKRKKLIRRVAALALSLLVGSGLALSSRAASPSEASMELRPAVSIRVDGTARTFYNAQGVQVHPIFYNGTHYLPVRAIGELMGKNVNWDQTTLTITLSGTRTTGAVQGTPDRGAVQQSIQAQIRPDFTIIVDGAVRTFRDERGSVVNPVLHQGTTYLPVRAVGELMGKTVSWDAASLVIALSPSGSGSLVTDADTFEPTPSAAPVPSTAPSANAISPQRAQEIALAHAGLRADQVTMVRTHLDRDDGRQVYEVEFYQVSGSVVKEYDYEIDAITGAIRDVDYDAEYYTRPVEPSPTAPAGTITAEKAKEIALARVPGATQSHIRAFERDYENGRLVYEGKIVYNRMEYEFEIDGTTGAVRKWEAESVYD